MWLGRAAQAAMLWEPHFSEHVNKYSPIEKFARRVRPICLLICRQDRATEDYSEETLH